MSAFVDRVSFFTEPAIKAGNDQLEFTVVPDWGSNLISLVEKRKNKELLRVPSSSNEYWEKPVLYGTPILFPPNRIDQGCFTFEGRNYNFKINEEEKQNHIHGFVHTKKWDVIKSRTDGTRAEIVTEFNSSKHGDIMLQFPHHYILRMNYILEGNVLEKNMEVINRSSETLPLGIGFHTSFLFPEDSSSFALLAEKRWVLDDRCLPTGELEEIPYSNKLKQGMSLKGLALDEVFLSSPGQDGFYEAKLSNQDSGVDISYKTDENFKHWVVYNMDGEQGFVCPKPYTWVTNAPNIDLPASLTGLQSLKPGERKIFKTKIQVTTIQ